MYPSTDAPPEWRRLLMTFLHFRAVARMQAAWAARAAPSAAAARSPRSPNRRPCRRSGRQHSHKGSRAARACGSRFESGPRSTASACTTGQSARASCNAAVARTAVREGLREVEDHSVATAAADSLQPRCSSRNYPSSTSTGRSTWHTRTCPHPRRVVRNRVACRTTSSPLRGTSISSTSPRKSRAGESVREGSAVLAVARSRVAAGRAPCPQCRTSWPGSTCCTPRRTAGRLRSRRVRGSDSLAFKGNLTVPHLTQRTLRAPARTPPA